MNISQEGQGPLVVLSHALALDRHMWDARIQAVRPALQTPAMRKRMETVGAEPGGHSPAEFAKQVADDARKWSEFVKTSGIQVTQ